MKNTIIALVVLVLLGAAGYFVWSRSKTSELSVDNTQTQQAPETVTPVAPPVSTSSVKAPEKKDEVSIGKSAGGRDIMLYRIGSGKKEILLIAGAHGGYEWNTTLLAYQMIDDLKAHPEKVPAGVTVSIVPSMNPDGLYAVTGKTGRFAPSDVSSDKAIVISGRYNANDVDLNRNFDCDWRENGVWQSTTVSGGKSAFSEPESKTIQAYVDSHALAAVVAYFSAAGGVFSSRCGGDVSEETSALTKLYADASGYPAFKNYDYYEITGDMVNWLAKKGIPAVSVLLTDHSGTELEKNVKGLDAVIARYAK